MNALWITFFLAVAASAVSASEDLKFAKIPKDDQHNIIRCDEGDPTTWKVLDSETVTATGKFLQIVEKTITYPQDGTGNYDLVCIRVIDQIGDGTGGIPDIIGGGLNFRYVTIHFQSQRSHGFKFTVQIYGKPISGGLK